MVLVTPLYLLARPLPNGERSIDVCIRQPWLDRVEHQDLHLQIQTGAKDMQHETQKKAGWMPRHGRCVSAQHNQRQHFRDEWGTTLLLACLKALYSIQPARDGLRLNGHRNHTDLGPRDLLLQKDLAFSYSILSSFLIAGIGLASRLQGGSAS